MKAAEQKEMTPSLHYKYPQSSKAANYAFFPSMLNQRWTVVGLLFFLSWNSVEKNKRSAIINFLSFSK